MIYQFSDCELLTDSHQLLVDGALQKIEPQVFSLIVFLVEQRHRVVTKDDLIDAVWGGRIVSESTVASQISAARAAIGDSGRSQRLIKTVHSRGFRFVGDVAVRDSVSVDRRAPSATASEAEPPEAPRDRSMPPGRPFPVRLVGGIGVAAVFVVAIALVMTVSKSPLGKPEAAESVVSSSDPAEDTMPEPRASIAVLPFATRSADDDLTYLADGMSEQVLNALARIGEIRVISRSSAFALPGKELTTAQIADAFNVSHILEGSLRSSEETVRINVQLLDTVTNTYAWSETFDRPLTAANMLVIEDEIARNVAGALATTLNVAGSPEAIRMGSLEILKLYVRGNHLLDESTPESIELAVEAFEKCLALDPGFALAHAGLALAHTRSIDALLVPASNVLDTIRYHLDRGMALAPTQAEILTAAAAFAQLEERRSDALDLAERAIASNPSHAPAHSIRAYELRFFGRHKEALAAYDVAVSLDPLNSETLTSYAWALLTSGDFAGAIEIMETNLKWQPDDYNYLTMLGYMNLQAGDMARSFDLYRRAHAINPRDYDVQAGLSMIFLSIGDLDRAANYAVAPTNVALTYLAQGDAQAAQDLMLQTAGPTVWAEFDTWLALGDSQRAYLAVRDRENERFKRRSNVAGTMAYGMYYAKIALAYRDAGDPLADQMIARVDQFYQGRRPGDFAMRNDLIGGALWCLLHDDTEGAVAWVNHAVDEGDAFLAYIQEPLFDPLTDHPAYPSIMIRMRQNAETHRQNIGALQAKING